MVGATRDASSVGSSVNVDRTKISRSPLKSPVTRSGAPDSNATVEPSPLIATSSEFPFSSLSLRNDVVSSTKSRTKTFRKEGPESSTRLFAVDSNATTVPSSLTTGSTEEPKFALLPGTRGLTSVVVPEAVVASSKRKAKMSKPRFCRASSGTRSLAKL